MILLKGGKTNWKYILIVVIWALFVGGGVWGWQWLAAKGLKTPEVTLKEEPEEPAVSLNVVEKTDLALSSAINRNNLSNYREFIKRNQQYKREILDTPLSDQLEEARRYLERYPAGKHAADLRAKLIEEFNISFLLDGLEERELVVTTVEVNQYQKYTEKKLLFTDPQVGTLFVLLLIPKQGEGGYPAIVGLHGHGDSAFGFRDSYFGKELAQEGFVMIMLSFRAMDCDQTEATISEELLSSGFTLIGLRIYEALLLIKYLNYLDFVDGARIGIIGHSGGSHTAHLVSRISDDLKAGVYDYDSYMLDKCGEEGIYIHCQTVPRLAYYDPQINDHTTFPFPTRMFEYGYPGKSAKQAVINFFKDNL